MLRLLKEDGTPMSLKEQEALCKKDKTQLVNPPIPKEALKQRVTRPKYAGLRPVGGNPKPQAKEDKKDVKTARQ